MAHSGIIYFCIFRAQQLAKHFACDSAAPAITHNGELGLKNGRAIGEELNAWLCPFKNLTHQTKRPVFVLSLHHNRFK